MKNLDNTIFILMGDHGNRFGAHVKQTLGWIESRMPYFNMLVPVDFLNQNPSIEYHLNANVNKLVTFFDLHETIKDLSNINHRKKYKNGSLTATHVRRKNLLWQNTRTVNIVPFHPLYRSTELCATQNHY